MSPLFAIRLGLDLIAAGCLLAALAYDWFGNAAHEIIGTAMFLLLISHNVFNRRWYGTIRNGLREPRGIFIRSVNLLLLAMILALLATSIIISRTVFEFLPFSANFTVRQIHALVAYIVLFFVGLHIGLQWAMLMRRARNWLGITADSRLRTALLRAATLAIAAYGVYSFFVVDIKTKLLMEMTISFWDFERAAVSFLLHHIAIVGLIAAISYYCLRLLDRVKQRSRPPRPV